MLISMTSPDLFSSCSTFPALPVRRPRESTIPEMFADSSWMPKESFDVLAYLVEHVGRVVTQDEILEALWPETYVNPEVLRKNIQEIRKALGDRPDNPEFIETLPKRGYRFISPVIDESGVEPPELATSHSTEEQATEATVEAEANPLAVESPSAKHVLWKLAIVLVLVVVAGAGIGAYFWPARSGANASSLNNSVAVLPVVDMSLAQDQED